MTDVSTGLTALELAALRKSDDICAFHREGRSFLRAYKFAVDQNIEIECGTCWTDYSRESGTSYPVPLFDAFAMVGNYTHSALRTIVTLLHVGDELSLAWVRDAGKSYVKDAGLHWDTVDLLVRRGDKRLRFHLDTNVCKDNSARMIQNVRAKVSQYSLT